MPGLSFLYSFKKDLLVDSSAFLKALNSANRNKRCSERLWLNGKFYQLGSSSYAEYPLTSFEDDSFIIFIEGKLYDKQNEEAKENLFNLARMISSSDEDDCNKIKEWLLSSDGDFLIFILNKISNDIYFINDALSRLPVYLYRDNNQFIISREQRFIINRLESIKFDQMSIAQTLLFGYALGNRTLIENIYRIGPSSLIKINTTSSEIISINLHTFNFEKKDHNRKIETSVNELVSLFIKACKDRANSIKSNKTILSLSGGLDSRSVAAGLFKEKCFFSTVTRLSYDKRESADAKLAKKIAGTFRVDWHDIFLAPPKGKDVLSLLRIKNGLNYLGMRNQIPFFEETIKSHGTNITFFSGDGGDKVFPVLKPSKNIRDIESLVHYVLSNNQRISLDQVSNLTRTKKEDIISELRSHLLSYPENDFNYKYVHFTVYERGFKWLFEGEDRNRQFFWSVAPFFSINFFNYGMNCPDSLKANYKLYREFLLKLSPEAAAITNKDWGFSILSKKRSLKMIIDSCKLLVPRKLKNALKKHISKDRIDQGSSIANCLLDQIKACDEINSYISIKSIMSLMPDLNKTQIDYLFTITSIIDDVTSKHSVLEKYAEAEFK